MPRDGKQRNQSGSAWTYGWPVEGVIPNPSHACMFGTRGRPPIIFTIIAWTLVRGNWRVPSECAWPCWLCHLRMTAVTWCKTRAWYSWSPLHPLAIATSYRFWNLFMICVFTVWRHGVHVSTKKKSSLSISGKRHADWIIFHSHPDSQPTSYITSQPVSQPASHVRVVSIVSGFKYIYIEIYI